MNLEMQKKLKILAKMYRIRHLEESIALRYSEGKMRCPVHLSIGQELVPAIFSEYIRDDDFAVSTHRGHAHYISKGGDINALVAELYGKATGCSKGRGGSMHLIDKNVGFMGTSAIVGNSIPIGVGLGLSIQLKDTEQISCVFLGDGAVEEGVFYESVNFAAVRGLPILFICENNFYSVYSPLSVRQPIGREIAKMVGSMGVNSFSCNTLELESNIELMSRAINLVRSEKRPVFVEFLTYRWREHCGPNFDNEIGYRSIEEFKHWQSLDPLSNLLQEFSGSHMNDLQRMQLGVEAEINAAFEFAENSPFPLPEEVSENIYA